MGSSSFTVQLVRLLLSLCILCVISAFERRSVRDIHLLFTLYFAKCDIDHERAAVERAHHSRCARLRTDSHNHRPCSSFRFRYALRRYPDLRPQSFPTVMCDATSGQGTPTCSWIRRLRVVLGFTCACGLLVRENRRDEASFYIALTGVIVTQGVRAPRWRSSTLLSRRCS